MNNETDKHMHGIIDAQLPGHTNDYLFRVSLKAFIINTKNEMLVVKESGRSWWDLPGGGMNHGESIRQALARELHEEVGLEGGFDFDIIDADDAAEIAHSKILQIRLVFWVRPQNMRFRPGTDGDEVAFMPTGAFHNDPYKKKKNALYLHKISLLKGADHEISLNPSQ